MAPKYSSKDRSMALRWAIDNAIGLGKLLVLYLDSDRVWCVNSHAATYQSEIHHMDGTRYILPYGEVTKLS